MFIETFRNIQCFGSCKPLFSVTKWYNKITRTLKFLLGPIEGKINPMGLDYFTNLTRKIGAELNSNLLFIFLSVLEASLILTDSSACRDNASKKFPVISILKLGWSFSWWISKCFTNGLSFLFFCTSLTCSRVLSLKTLTVSPSYVALHKCK